MDDVVFEAKNGNATLNTATGTIQITVPTDRSFLSMTNNRFGDGEEFNDDGYVYRDGKRLRKWFGTLWDNGRNWRIWEPKLKDIKALEQSRWNSIQYCKRWFEKWVMPKYRDVCAIGGDIIEVHAMAYRRYRTGTTLKGYDNCSREWIKYQFTPSPDIFNTDGWTYSYTHQWLEDDVTEPLHLDVGQPFCDIERQSWHIYKRKHIFEVAFTQAIDSWLNEGNNIEQPKCDDMLCLNINGREYWFGSGATPMSAFRWIKVFWPESPLKQVTV
ncbi:MAG: hypothetical protein WDA42_01480 [Candidatus Bathyarchaeia archaeon]|jgi:hypothetical protein